MGKTALLWVGATVVIGTVLLLQADIGRLQADDRQVVRQEETLAREIARSAYDRILSLARELERQHPDWMAGELVVAVNEEAGRLTGQLQGGSYGGQGWHERDAYGYYQLRDYYKEPGGGALVPDFSDQVIEVTFVPVDAGA